MSAGKAFLIISLSITGCFGLFHSCQVFGQSTDTSGQRVFIQGIKIFGNKKTKTNIILREMTVHSGDSLPVAELNRMLRISRENIYNTRLFISADLNPVAVNDHEVVVNVVVKERWYTLPLPYLELADRSFNVWWHTYHASLRRLSYGMYFIQENLSGRNDLLEIKATAGFNKQLNVEYTSPFIDKNLTGRLRPSAGILVSNEIPYATSEGNKLQYFQSTKPVRREWFVSLGYLARKKIKKREWFTLSLTGINLSDSISYYNPDFLGNGITHIVYPEIKYKIRYDDVDNVIYPLKGHSYEGIISKRGIQWSGGLNRIQLISNAYWYFPVGNEWFTAFRLGGGIQLPFAQPYFNTRAMGYGDAYLRGYEYYVIDGVAYFMAKAELKKKIFHFSIPTPFTRSENYSSIPITFYAKVFSDIGGVFSRQKSMLSDNFLWGNGVGLDIVTLYDISVSINFSLNNMGESGIYYHATR